MANWSQTELDKIWRSKHGNASSASCTYKYCKYKHIPMKKNDYGVDYNTSWVVDHIKPVSKGGGDNIENLRPLHNWCNQDKGDTY